MNEHDLRGWLANRDPGVAPGELRAQVAAIPDLAPRPWTARVLAGLGSLERHDHRGSRTGLVVVAIALIAALSLSAALIGSGLLRTTQPWLPSGAWIAYSRDGAIHVVRPDGTDDRDVSGGRVTDATEPRWSPDGARLAFIAAGDLYVFLADGTLRNLTRDPDIQRDPTWSPDGTSLLVMTMSLEPSVDRLDLVPADGGGRRVLAPFSATGQSAWSPDGRFIAFWYAGRPTIVRPDGTGLRTVGSGSQVNSLLRWAPDSQTLAYSSCYCKGYGVGLINTVTIGPTGDVTGTRSPWLGLPPPDATSGGPSYVAIAWSPDGRRIALAVVGTSDSPTTIMIGDGDGRTLVPLTRLEVGGFWNSITVPIEWSPDGEAVAFADQAGLTVADVATGATTTIAKGSILTLDWRPGQ